MLTSNAQVQISDPLLPVSAALVEVSNATVEVRSGAVKASFARSELHVAESRPRPSTLTPPMDTSVRPCPSKWWGVGTYS